MKRHLPFDAEEEEEEEKKHHPPNAFCSLPLDLLGAIALFLKVQDLARLACCCLSLKHDMYSLKGVKGICMNEICILDLSTVSVSCTFCLSPLIHFAREVQIVSNDRESFQRLKTLMQGMRLPNVSRLHIVFASNSVLKPTHDILFEDPCNLSQNPLFSGLCHLLNQIKHLRLQGEKGEKRGKDVKFLLALDPLSSGLLQAIPAGHLESLEVDNRVSHLFLQGFWPWILIHQPHLRSVSLSCHECYSETEPPSAGFSLTIRCERLNCIARLPRVNKLRVILKKGGKIEHFSFAPNTFLEVIIVDPESFNQSPINFSLFQPPLSSLLLSSWKEKMNICSFQVYPPFSSTEILFKTLCEYM